MARNRAARAISIGSPMRPIKLFRAMSSTNLARRSASFVMIMSVATVPGVSALTRMPSAAHSLAKVRVKLTMAALAAQ